MRLVTGAIRNAYRSPSASATSSVAVAAGRPAVPRGNLVEAVIPSPLRVRDTREGRPARQAALVLAMPLGACAHEPTLRRSRMAMQASPRRARSAGDRGLRRLA